MILIWECGNLYPGRYENGYPVKTRETAIETNVTMMRVRKLYPNERILIRLKS